MKALFKCLSLAVIICTFSGCAHYVKVIPTPGDADIALDGDIVGNGVTKVKLPDPDPNMKYKVSALPPEGYFPVHTRVSLKSPRSIELNCPKDHSFFETVSGVDVVNKWIVLEVGKKYKDEEAWRKLTSSITAAIADFEVLDQKSLYLKSAWKVAGKRYDTLRTRSRIIVAVDDPDPKNLTFKLKIESERINLRGDVVEKIPRTFKDFLDALETAQGRLKN